MVSMKLRCQNVVNTGNLVIADGNGGALRSSAEVDEEVGMGGSMEFNKQQLGEPGLFGIRRQSGSNPCGWG